MANPLQVLTIIGARPQIIKAAAISHAVRTVFQGRIAETLLHTGQHYDSNMSQVFFDELGIPRADIDLGVGSGAHGVQTARMIEGVEKELQSGKYDAVLLYGDTNSTLAGAVAAAKLHIPVAHVEAGLRSFNKAMPEEVNRIVCDHCSTWLFCPTDTAMRNLVHEGFPAEINAPATANRPHVVASGDVMYDNSMRFAELAAQRSTLLKEVALQPGGFILATVHRDHNTDDAARINAIFGALLDMHRTHRLPIVLPVHPRTRKMMGILLEGGLQRAIAAEPGFHLLPPVGFLDMIALERGAKLVITDSGGVQKEAYFFGKPAVVLRPETEWVELVEQGQAVLADADPATIARAAADFLSHGVPRCPPIFGDGHAAEAICMHLLGR
ncbi:MAG TPA: UDP-N-acetylglucosamine 2-epimerase (non-hydrolyzing) [Flavobacteriales bacterium]|nr:UDP-N-acetylglucosamine 2-epimerase (non-hydrolyzing) [Flavobacteriales bacterium]HRP82230.1 UDP-N-acetylglucosamine 2-epimerase (non-hydrolyzing) [Flavobacteriales bacterium]